MRRPTDTSVTSRWPPCEHRAARRDVGVGAASARRSDAQL